MDAWQQSIENRLTALASKVDTHLFWLLGAFAAGFLLLAGLVLNRTDSLEQRLSAKIDGLSGQIASLKTDVAVIKATPRAAKAP